MPLVATSESPLTGNSSGFFRPFPHNSGAPQRSSPHSPGLSCRDCLLSSKPMFSEAARKGPPSKREADLPTSHSPAVRSTFSMRSDFAAPQTERAARHHSDGGPRAGASAIGERSMPSARSARRTHDSLSTESTTQHLTPQSGQDHSWPKTCESSARNFRDTKFNSFI